MRTLDSTPISHGLDFERAREVLANRYGQAFNAYSAAKREGRPVAVIAEKLDEARSAQARLRALRPQDGPGIAAVLAHPPSR